MLRDQTLGKGNKFKNGRLTRASVGKCLSAKGGSASGGKVRQNTPRHLSSFPHFVIHPIFKFVPQPPPILKFIYLYGGQNAFLIFPYKFSPSVPSQPTFHRQQQELGELRGLPLAHRF